MKYIAGVVLGIVVTLGVGYALVKTNLIQKVLPTAQPITITTTIGNNSASPAPAATAAPSPTPNEEDFLKAAVKAALVAKRGQDASSLNISVTKVEGSYASGMASSTGGGGLWYAAKINGNWNLVWDGNGTISCSDLTPYPNFPTSMISQCWNSVSQTIVNR